MKQERTENKYSTFPDDKILKSFMGSIGVPAEKFGLYKEFVAWEYRHRSGIVNLEHYAGAQDFTSPDRNEALEEQNVRIRELRASMETTRAGRKKIEQMRKRGVGNETTVPFPVLED